MTMEITLDRLQAANPVPQPDREEVQDDVLLLMIQERSMSMSTNTEHEAVKGIPDLAGQQPPKRRPGWIIALAVFAAVIILGAAIALITIRSDEVDPATTLPTPTTTTAAPTTTTEATTTTTALDPENDWDAIPGFGSGDAQGLVRTTDFAVPLAFDIGSTQYQLDLEREDWISIGSTPFGPVRGIDAVLTTDTIEATVAVFNAIHDEYPDAEMTDPVPATLGGAEGVVFSTVGLPTHFTMPEDADHSFIATYPDDDEVRWTVAAGSGEIFVVDVDGQTVVVGYGVSRQCLAGCDTGTATPGQVETAKERLRAVVDSIVWRDLP